MSDSTVSDIIRQFFGGNFHQDWDVVAAEWEGVVDSYANGKDRARLMALADEIESLRNDNDEAALAYLVPRQAHSAYDPRPLTTYSDWLRQVSERIRQHAFEIEHGGTPR